MPVFAQLGVIYKDDRYYEKMYEMYMHTKNVEGAKGLYNLTEKLWYRDKDFDPPYTTPAGKSCYWSRGDGWIVAALVRVLDIMPKNAPHREEYEKTYLEMMQALPAYQRTDGFWNVSITDETDFGGKELTGTALFTYGMAWGINKGLLNKKKYTPIIAKAMNAMIKDCLHPNGFFGLYTRHRQRTKRRSPLAMTKYQTLTILA